MSGLGRLIGRFHRNEGGATVVEAALMTSVFIMVVGGGLELGLYYWQTNTAQQAARTGARLAATHDPVARELKSKTWLTDARRTGDPLPDYDYVCDGASESCTQGGYSQNAMKVLTHGPDRKNCNQSGENRAAQGMCDFIPDIRAENVTIRYAGSGLGTAGSPADPQPIITVTLSGLSREVLFLERLLGKTAELRPVSVTVMAEDMRAAR